MIADPPASDPSTPPARIAPVVLIVDDDDAVRTSLLRLLKALGYAAKGYASGEAFLADLSGTRADCVVLDLLMPALQGDRVVAAMRQVWPDVPVISSPGRTIPGWTSA